MKSGTKFLLIALILILGSGFGLYYWWSQRDIVVTLNPRYLEETIGAEYPFDRRLLGMHFHLDAPKITLPPNQARIFADYQGFLALPLLNRQFRGGATLSSRISYRAAEGTFYLEDILVENVAFEGIPPAQNQMLAGQLREMGRGMLMSLPIYTLDKNDTRQNVTRYLLKRVEVKDQQLQLILGIGS